MMRTGGGEGLMKDRKGRQEWQEGGMNASDNSTCPEGARFYGEARQLS
jgi:hypothetical protein